MSENNFEPGELQDFDHKASYDLGKQQEKSHNFFEESHKKFVADIKREAREEAAKYAHWVIGQYLEKDNVQLLMGLPGKIERGEFDGIC